MKKRKFIVFLLIIVVQRLFPQANETQTSAWANIQANYSFAKRYEVNLAQQIRYSETDSQIRWYVTDINLAAALNNQNRVSTKYRFKTRKDAAQHSLYLDYRYRTQKKPLRLYYRFRVNKKLRFDKEDNSLTRRSDEDHVRNRVLIKYITKSDFRPYLGAELFYLIGNADQKSGFDIFRYYFGLEYELSKKHELELSWVYEEIFNLGNLGSENTLKIKYSFDLN